MASSRWKRFAFFDRKNLKIPAPIFDDILPPDNNQNDRRNLINTNNSTNDRNSIAESVSLAVINGAGVPYASLPEQPSGDDPRLGVLGMAATLEACNQYGGGANKSTDTDDDINTHEGQLLASSFQFSSSGQTLATPAGIQKKSGNVNGSLVLAFISSRSTRRVHCIDLTVRCNPIHDLTSSPSTSHNIDGMLERNDDKMLPSGRDGHDFEDLDGWRGYFLPFSYDTSSQVAETPNAANNSAIPKNSSPSVKHPRIVGMAVCSDHEATAIKSGKNIYVACITDVDDSVGVTVHRNPHLYLNDSMEILSNRSARSSSATNVDSANAAKKLKSTPKVEIYQPLGEFDFRHRGRPTCVDISYQSGTVAVGTSTGMVILYGINPFSSGIGQQSGSNGTKKLSLLMEIPAPPTASSGNDSSGGGGSNVSVMESEVSCVKLVSELIDSTIDEEDNGGLTRNAQRKSQSTSNNETERKTKLFVTYRRVNRTDGSTTNNNRPSTAASAATASTSTTGGGICCYNLGVININSASNSSSSTSTPSARYDLDGREVTSSCICDVVVAKRNVESGQQVSEADRLIVARSDGLYTYSSTDKEGVSPIDGTKIAMCAVPPPPVSRRKYYSETFLSSIKDFNTSKDKEEFKLQGSSEKVYMQSTAASDVGASYVLIAMKDSKSGRDAVDIYDSSNKLVANHFLLSPGHKALQAVGVTTSLRSVADGSTRGGLSSAIIITTGGSLITLREKVTADKVALLVQKNLYSAAISMAFADPFYKAIDITLLFQRHAEHLFRKGDFAAAMDQYMYTIGSLEPSHVIFRYIEAPKIPLLVKYLEELRAREMATPVHCELLKTCYLKLNDVNMAEKTSALLSKSLNSASTKLVSNLLHNPSEALAAICSFEAPHAVEALKIHGSVLARALPRETAGIVISLCDGVYSPGVLAGVGERRKVTSDVLKELLESKHREVSCEMYPVHLFSTAFMENPKLLRVILYHCFSHKRTLSISLKRTLLQLILEEWSAAKSAGNSDLQKSRRDDAISILMDPNSNDEVGDYESLVIVQQHDFVEGEILLYERLQMVPLLIEKYAQEGTYKARRQMLAMCRSDPEILGEVLGHFVNMTTENLNQENHKCNDDASVNSESELGELLDDVKEALQMAKSQGVLQPVRIARILAGDGVGQFRNDYGPDGINKECEGVPLSVALDYIGSVLDEKSEEVKRLKGDVEDYNSMCNSMETEIQKLLSYSEGMAGNTSTKHDNHLKNIDINGMYSKLLDSSYDTTSNAVEEKKSEAASEEFWRAIGQAEDRFGTIARFFAKDIID